MSIIDINKRRASLFPVRPLTMLPTPSGESTIDNFDKMVIIGLYPLATTPSSSSIDFYMQQGVAPQVKVILKGFVPNSTDTAGDMDITAWVTSFGSIKRALQYDIGKVKTGSNGISIFNHSREPHLMTDGAENGFMGVNTNLYRGSTYPGGGSVQTGAFWLQLSYEIYMGFKKDSVPDVEWYKMYTGYISRREEDRINNIIKISSFDSLRRLADMKYCKTYSGFAVGGNYGEIEHVIITGFGEIYSSTKKNYLTQRNDPMWAVEGIPNQSSAKPKGYSGSNLDANKLWYFPIENLIYGQARYARFYMWDYRKEYKSWRMVRGTIQDPGSWDLEYDRTNYPGLFFLTVGTSFFLEGDIEIDLDDYLEGTGDFADDETDPAFSVSPVYSSTRDAIREDYLNDIINPAAILKDIITSSGYMEDIDGGRVGFSEDLIDPSTWSYVKNKLKTKGFVANKGFDVRLYYKKEVTALQMVNDICEMCGLNIFASKSESVDIDHTIKLIDSYDDYLDSDYPLKNVQLVFSTKNKLKSCVIEHDIKETYTRINVPYFDGEDFNDFSKLPIKFNQNLDIYKEEKAFTIGKSSNPNVWLFSASNVDLQLWINDIAENYQRLYSSVPEIYNVDFGKAGFDIDIGEIVTIHDGYVDQYIDCQVIETSLDLRTGNKTAKLRKLVT